MFEQAFLLHALLFSPFYFFQAYRLSALDRLEAASNIT
jgi:hypothetical protein